MADQIAHSSPTDPLAQPLVEDLIREYDERYGTLFSANGARDEVFRYPPEAFAPPDGAFLLILRDGEAVAGGAFMRYDATTAELKRIWTRGDLRRQGLARRIVLALEDQAAELGYTRLYLTTGFRQPEAKGLYLGLAYRPLFDPALPTELYGTLPFEKHIGLLAGKPGTAPVKQPAASREAAILAVSSGKAAAVAGGVQSHAAQTETAHGRTAPGQTPQDQAFPGQTPSGQAAPGQAVQGQTAQARTVPGQHAQRHTHPEGRV